ncbi:hypothetical protein IPH92_00435 [Candidatus Kaiserbacteria bacterium]|nr:MAG: hypothetical protein IPH92_00435 [Candidatus Kaiserbacteria bacterium]
MTGSNTWTFMALGSVVGGYIPALWGAGFFSFSSLIFSTLGALVGIWLAYRMNS